MTCILGIDPGSRITGFGVIRQQGQKISYINSGCIRTQGEDFNARLGEIFLGVQQIISAYNPSSVAIEKVFVMKNVESALKLGQARGAALSACVIAGLKVDEYSPTQVKRTIVGVGRADKGQVQHMVKQLLQLSDTPPSDAADALAIALCHVQHAGLRRLTAAL